MIRLVNLCYANAAASHQRVLFHNASASFPPGSRSAILGAPGAGKSTLARLLSGKVQPDRGHVLGSHQVIAPLGYAAAFNPWLSGAENIRHLARLLGADSRHVLAFAAWFCELGADFDRPVQTYTPVMRASLGYALSYAIPRPFLLADETTGTGDERFRAKCDAMLLARLESCGLIFLTRQASTASRFCDQFYALARGRLLRCDSAAAAQQLALLENPEL